ncbi:transglutaminase domain-containing protein [Paenibacillus daejeonensis]|uniref:transglutaminase domain-containing protein n=1 Tax=Paenibacillus daejeonensis TaxID=135193 RepID=UPI00036585B5|nr:transglutaminase-like domain-containing protein [Paenibacillus daejeonensis]
MQVKPIVFSLGEAALSAIERKFDHRRELAGNRAEALFGVFSQKLTAEETWALKFLYANMPLSDLADYSGELFLSHIRQALATREKVAWGSSVPDELFLNYVLPLRINNENLEDYQPVLYNELTGRTERLSMGEAILETNYWCHERATYIGSDLRTLSPLSMIRNARGRCGEESTLAVAALRSIGIPARQCYTPRWAHVDDNHAWVEAWADGTWHYIGACEPEPVLDEGWFSGPARRAMLVHTRVPSGYDGPETVTVADEWHTEINLLEHYAPVRTLQVIVLNAGGAPAAGTEVQFQLYNYAELFPLAAIMTDGEGKAVFKTGLGELIVRAARGGFWDERRVIADEDEVTLVLRQQGQPAEDADFGMVPPPEREGEARAPLSEERLAEHQERMAVGEQMRKAYEATFLNEQQARKLAADLRLPADRVWCVLETARGHAYEIAAFLQNHTPEHGLWPLRLLESLNPKDLTDTSRLALDDFLLGGLEGLDGMDAGIQGDCKTDQGEASEEHLLHTLRYVLCPRVQFEMLAPYKRELLSAFTAEEVEAFRVAPARLAELVAGGWTIRRERTHMQGKATPAGTFRLRTGDQASVDILLVALLRTCGIPARLHPSRQRPQYWHQGKWADAGGDSRSGKNVAPHHHHHIQPGTLRLVQQSSAKRCLPELAYRENASLGRLVDGFYQTLLYPFGEKEAFTRPVELLPGDYRLITGIRLQNGSVLGRFHYFRMEAGEETVVVPVFRQPEVSYPVLGYTDGSSPLYRWHNPESGVTLESLAGGQGAVVAWIDPRREPSRHLLRESGELKAGFEEAGVPLLLIVPEGPEGDSFEPAAYPGLPLGTELLQDNGSEGLQQMAERCHPGEHGYPWLYVVDDRLAVRYAQSGYRPGSVREALQVLRVVSGQGNREGEEK